MAVLEKKLENGLIKHYSNNGRMLRQIETGILYTEAIDIIPCKYTYEESDESYEIRDEIVVSMIEEVL